MFAELWGLFVALWGRLPTGGGLLTRLFLSATICTAQALQPETISAGKIQFGESCAVCHGANAEGGRGPNLTEADRLRHMTDDQLFNTIRHGIPGSAMPAFPLPDKTIRQISAFVRSLSTPAFLVPIAGDANAGRQIYEKEKCASCHMIVGHGGFLGPDLTDIAALRTVKQLRESIVSPKAMLTDGFAGVSVTLKNGERISGIAKNYSNYALDILDERGKLHLLRRSEVQDIQFATKPLMPDTYAHTLSADELQNLLAFLCRQAVRPEAKLDQSVSDHREH